MKRALALGLLLGSGAALGAPVRDGLSQEARAKFDEGSALYQRSSFEAARQAFIVAYTQSGDPRILYNVAACDKSLGQYARAMNTLKRSLAQTDRSLPPDYTQRAAETIATLSRYVAFVTLASPQEGVVFSVDGEEIKENPTAMETGSHTISARKDGYEPVTRTVDVVAGKSRTESFELMLSTRPGLARVACRAAQPCTIRIGQEVLGTAPLEVSRSSGIYRISAFIGERNFDEQSVRFENGKTINVELVGRVQQLARLRVSTERATDIVTIDGKPAGLSGVERELTPGEHRVTVSRGDASKMLDVVLRENETRDLRMSMDERTGGISGWWFVAGGTVLVAGAVVTALAIALRTVNFQSTAPGTLTPNTVPAFEGFR